jgi:hypothetical protein
MTEDKENIEGLKSELDERKQKLDELVQKIKEDREESSENKAKAVKNIEENRDVMNHISNLLQKKMEQLEQEQEK